MMTDEKILNLLFPDRMKLYSADFYEALYPKRNLIKGAMVTRFAPSPTGFMHIGGVYTALINKKMAEQSGGIFYLRIEDTDILRSQKDAGEIITNILNKFSLVPDEGVINVTNSEYQQKGDYGPYIQSQRKLIYHTFILELLRKGMAYPCFLDTEELNGIRMEQRRLKLKPGCYGAWAKWRDADLLKIEEKLAANAGCVIRLKSAGEHAKKISWNDMVKGRITMPKNDIDIILLKSDGLPTYHFAHVVDDHLMRTTHVIRGDEWLSSVPVHLQLFDSLGWQPPVYAHIAPIEKEDHSDGYVSRRKLSKRKDSEANIQFYLKMGFPEEAVTQYLFNLMDSSFLKFQLDNPEKSSNDFLFSLEKLATHGALSDVDKLKSISKELISKMHIETLYSKVVQWTKQWDHELYVFMQRYPEYTKQALNIERDGQKPCKRFSTLEDTRQQLFFMYDELYEMYADCTFLPQISAEERPLILREFFQSYLPNLNKQEWLSHLKKVSTKFNYSDSVREYKLNPNLYKGHFGDIAMLLRIVICGVSESPDLWEVMRVLGLTRINSRLKKWIAE